MVRLIRLSLVAVFAGIGLVAQASIVMESAVSTVSIAIKEQGVKFTDRLSGGKRKYYVGHVTLNHRASAGSKWECEDDDLDLVGETELGQFGNPINEDGDGLIAEVQGHYEFKKEEGGRHTPFHNKYRPSFRTGQQDYFHITITRDGSVVYEAESRGTEVTGEITLEAGRYVVDYTLTSELQSRPTGIEMFRSLSTYSGSTQAVPEPATFAVMAIGAWALLRRRSR